MKIVNLVHGYNHFCHDSDHPRKNAVKQKIWSIDYHNMARSAGQCGRAWRCIGLSPQISHIIISSTAKDWYHKPHLEG